VDDTSAPVRDVRKYAVRTVELLTMLQGMATDSVARLSAASDVQVTEAAMDWILAATDETVPDFAGPSVADREFPDFHDAWFSSVIDEVTPRKVVRREDVS